jgi:hypothetical protein
MTKLSNLTKVTTVGDDALFYIVDPARSVGDRSVGMDKDDVKTLVGGGGAVVSKTGTTIEFTEPAFYNEITFLTSGNLTLDFTGAVLGTTIWVYCDRYVPEITGENFFISGNISIDKLNILMCTYDGERANITVSKKSYLSAPTATIESTPTQNILSNFGVANTDSYSIKFNTVNDEGSATDVPSYDGTSTTYTHTGLTNGQIYYYFIIATGNGYLTSETGLANGTPPALNTFIGGVGATITSANDYATITSLDVNDISAFTIDANNNVSCFINTNYSFNTNALTGNLDLTYFIDESGNVTLLNDGAFYNTYNCRLMYMPSLITSGINNWRGAGSGNIAQYDVFSISSLTPISTDATNNFTFNFLNVQNLYTNLANQTNNGGSPDGDLTNPNFTVNTINYVSNTNKPNAVSDLSVSNVYGTQLTLTWTAPAATNGIDGYIIFLNGNYETFTTTEGINLTGLSLNTSYSIEIITVDGEGNLSSFSEEVVQSTASDYAIPTANIIHYYPMEADSTDFVQNNDGVDTAMSYTEGGSGVGNSANFTAGTTSRIELPAVADMSFVDGSGDLPFSLIWDVRHNTVSSPYYIAKVSDDLVTHREYYMFRASGNLYCRQWDMVNAQNLDIVYPYTPVANEWDFFIFTSDGNKNNKLYRNGILVSQIDASANPSYVSMSSGNVTTKLGRGHNFSATALNGFEDEVAFCNVELSSEQVTEIWENHEQGNRLIAL